MLPGGRHIEEGDAAAGDAAHRQHGVEHAGGWLSAA